MRFSTISEGQVSQLHTQVNQFSMAPPEYLYFDVSSKANNYSNLFHDSVKQKKKSSYHHMQTAMKTDGSSSDMRTRIITPTKSRKKNSSRSMSVSLPSNKNYDKKSYRKKYKKSKTRSYTMGSESTKSSSRNSSIWNWFSFNNNTKKPAKQTDNHLSPIFEVDDKILDRGSYLKMKAEINELDNSSILSTPN
ncbi:MAG: hypothetical protein GY821_14250 [Gammaproteobacteria bacterium]|nr:hypothetical protein [Gammaproteobacteria bacterium]